MPQLPPLPPPFPPARRCDICKIKTFKVLGDAEAHELVCDGTGGEKIVKKTLQPKTLQPKEIKSGE